MPGTVLVFAIFNVIPAPILYRWRACRQLESMWVISKCRHKFFKVLLYFCKSSKIKYIALLFTLNTYWRSFLWGHCVQQSSIETQKNLTRELVLTFTSRSRQYNLMKIAEVLVQGDVQSAAYRSVIPKSLLLSSCVTWVCSLLILSTYLINSNMQWHETIPPRAFNYLVKTMFL